MIDIITLVTLDLSNFIGLFLGAMIASIILSVLFYIYSSLALMFIAKRTNTRHAWLAWIPYANIYLISKIAQKHWWPILLIPIPIIMSFFLNNLISSIINYAIVIVIFIFIIIWWWKIFERRGRPGWWALISIIPIIGWILGLIMIGMLAWGKDKSKTKSWQGSNEPNKELVEYLKKYSSEGYTIQELRKHLIDEGQNPAEIDEAIRYIQ